MNPLEFESYFRPTMQIVKFYVVLRTKSYFSLHRYSLYKLAESLEVLDQLDPKYLLKNKVGCENVEKLLRNEDLSHIYLFKMI